MFYYFATINPVDVAVIEAGIGGTFTAQPMSLQREQLSAHQSVSTTKKHWGKLLLKLLVIKLVF